MMCPRRERSGANVKNDKTKDIDLSCQRQAIAALPRGYDAAMNQLQKKLQSDLHPTLQAALAAHRAGHPVEARQLCQKLFDEQPDCAEGWNHLGLLIDESGDSDGAMECWRKAIALRPDLAEAHNNLG